MATQVNSLERNLKDLSVEGLVAVADNIKAPNITVLRLFVAAKDSRDVNDRFTLLDRKTTQACLHFARSLAQAVGGWLQQLELGLRLWNQELKLLAEALCPTKTLRLLSFANSGLGDTRFQILARSLRECVPLNTLNLSGCGPTDMNVPFIVNIVKGMPSSERIKPAEYTPGQMNFEQALECRTKVQKTSTSALKELDLQSTLRQSATRHSTCIPSKEIANAGTQGLRVLDLSYNHFTDDLVNELCPILYGEALLSALNLQCNKLTREGASMFGAVMKEKKVLLLVDLRDNKLEVPTAALTSDDTAVLKDISVPIFPKEASSTVKPAVVPEFRESTMDKYKKNFLAKPKTHVIRKQTPGSTIYKSMAAGESSNHRPMCRSPGVHVAINKLPSRTKSIPERFHRRLVSTPMTNRQCLYSMNSFTMLSVNSESERSSQILSNSRKNLRCKRTREMGRPMTAPLGEALELQFLNGKGCKAGDNQEMPPTITPLDLKQPLPSSTVTSKEDSQWNSLTSEMTMTLLNLKGTPQDAFSSRGVLEHQFKADANEDT